MVELSGPAGTCSARLKYAASHEYSPNLSVSPEELLMYAQFKARKIADIMGNNSTYRYKLCFKKPHMSEDIENSRKSVFCRKEEEIWQQQAWEQNNNIKKHQALLTQLVKNS